MTKVLGYKKFVSKNGNACAYLYIHKSFSDFEVKQQSASGTTCESIFIPAQLQDKLLPTIVGKDVQLFYTKEGNEARLSGLTIV